MKASNLFFIIIGIAGLICVRYFEDSFYDPFLHYFHLANKKAVFPGYELFPLILSHIGRFFLNLFFSVIVIHFMFRKKNWTLQGLVLICIFFAITFPIYLYCIYTKFEVGYLFSFYVRRFVIQPLVLLLIIPLFYYRKFLISR